MFDRVKMILEFSRMFGDLDFGKLKEAFAFLRQAADGELSLAERVDAALQGLRLLAAVTPTDKDDRLIEMIDKIIGSPLQDTLVDLLDRYLPKDGPASDGVYGQVVTMGRKNDVAALFAAPGQAEFTPAAMEEMPDLYYAQVSAQAIPWGLFLMIARLVASLLAK